MTDQLNRTQFHTNDVAALKHDANWWTSRCIAYLNRLQYTNAKSEDGIELRAVLCSQIAALGLSMAEHFGSAVVSLGHGNNDAILKSSMAVISQGSKHTESMELRAKRNAS